MAAAAGVSLLTNLVRLLFLGLVGVGGFFGWKAWTREGEQARALAQRDAAIARLSDELGQARAENTRLSADLELAKHEIERLALSLKLLKVERRVARLIVVDQSPSETAGRVVTRVRFEEVDPSGAPLAPAVEASLEGDVLYVDAWVVKFDDVLVEQGDGERGASLCLFRRLFGEFQQPSEGVPLDRSGERPAAYGGDPMGELEARLWDEFWEIANDARRAAALGVRAAHGEAPSMRTKEGEVYTLTLRASGGLSIQLDRAGAGGN